MVFKPSPARRVRGRAPARRGLSLFVHCLVNYNVPDEKNNLCRRLHFVHVFNMGNMECRLSISIVDDGIAVNDGSFDRTGLASGSKSESGLEQAWLTMISLW